MRIEIAMRASGSANQANISPYDVESLSIKIPPLKTQQRIADILYAYDELIENNNRRIQILEEMAEQLYKEWFVRMRFPNYQNTKFVKGIPEGWEVKKLGEVTNLIKRGISPEYSDEGDSIVINQKCIRDRSVNLELSRLQRKKIPKEKILQKWDIIVNSTGEGTLGRVSQIRSLEENIDLTVDSHVTIIRSNKTTDPHFLGTMLMDFQSVFENLALGATGQTELGRKDIANIKVSMPNYSLQALFGSNIQPIREEQEILSKQNQNLRQTRDLLLPRLISGKLSIKEAEKELQEVG